MNNTFKTLCGVTDQLTTVAPINVSIPKPAPATPAAPTHKWYDIVTGLVNTTSNLATSAADVVTSVKSPSGSNPTYVNNVQPPAPVVKSNTGTYVLVGTGLLVLIGGAALIMRKRKKKA